jgi:iron complex outermembrane receptor protein
MPSITTYDSTGIGDVSYETALAAATSIDEDACADSKDFNKFLPNLGVNYKINEELSSYVSYGRNYGMSVSLYPYFISQKQTFYSKGITLQDLWDKQELEIVDNFDIGLRYITDKLYVVPTLYYAHHKNKAATYYDSSLGVSFPSTNAEADAYGFELEAGALVTKNCPFTDRFPIIGSFLHKIFLTATDPLMPLTENRFPMHQNFYARQLQATAWVNLFFHRLLSTRPKDTGMLNTMRRLTVL